MLEGNNNKIRAFPCCVLPDLHHNDQCLEYSKSECVGHRHFVMMLLALGCQEDNIAPYLPNLIREMIDLCVSVKISLGIVDTQIFWGKCLQIVYEARDVPRSGVILILFIFHQDKYIDKTLAPIQLYGRTGTRNLRHARIYKFCEKKIRVL